MIDDCRAGAATYYDLAPAVNDVPFYLSRIPSPDASILELGCGTGRVLLLLSEACRHIHGIDHSEGMLDVCRRKLREALAPESKAKVQTGDITDLNLGWTFDLIIAPYRVIQNLETDAQLDGLFETVNRHLSPHGTCILNVFMPNASADEIK
jgi:ubiquinone/menaquinone biosynthesis C-methylase UbiE